MRTYVYAGALVGCAMSGAFAQQPDSVARTDSVARADSIQRADSARRARELGRIRSEPHNRARRAGQPAQRSSRITRPAVRFEVALGLPSTLVEDANGTTVRTGMAALAGIAGTWMLSPRLQSAVGIRASTASITADAGSSDWKAGRTTQVGARAALEQRFDVGLGVFVAGSGTWLMGPDDVTPFRDDAGLRWGGDAGLTWRARTRQRIGYFVAVETLMIGGATATDPIQSTGWTRRFIIGVRHGS